MKGMVERGVGEAKAAAEIRIPRKEGNEKRHAVKKDQERQEGGEGKGARKGRARRQRGTRESTE